METKKGFLTTHEVVRIFQEEGIPIQEFIDAVKSGEIDPCWDDGSFIDFADLVIALNEIEKVKKMH